MSTSDITAILADPTDNGFVWEMAELTKGSMTWKNIPRMSVTDLSKFRATFGDDVVLASLNGTSLRVKNQTIREALYTDSAMSRDVLRMQRWIVESALGIKQRSFTVVTVTVEVQKFVANDGTVFDNKPDCMAHNIDIQQNA